ncbi:MAG: sigma-54-dependent Fis family transcriptional regulator [Planctomycetaceae bacterium]|nr:MAG: sigma-54-dependent Fis family transcriptional regulator [Planctomycetaceae bacterium]
MSSPDSDSPLFSSPPHWLAWEEIPGFTRSSPAAADLQLAIRLLETALEAESIPNFLRDKLPEIASELAAPWTAVLQRTTEWVPLAEFGRRPLPGPFAWFLHEVLERDAAGSVAVSSTAPSSSWTLLAAPLQRKAQLPRLLVAATRGEPLRPLSSLLLMARGLGFGLSIVGRQALALERSQKLHATLRIAAQLGSITETQSLLEKVAREAAPLLECDRASIFVWDRPHRELMACPALGLAEGILRIPDDQGIVGECVQQGSIIRVDDAYLDQRFNREVDLQTGYRTRNLLCVPLVTSDGQRVGAFEVLNKKTGDFTELDTEILVELGRQAVVALDQAREREHLIRRQRQLTDQFSQNVRIVGDSPQIAALRNKLDRLATTDLSVLLLGESGTGKEVVAQILHDRSPRRDHPFIAVNCAAMPESLLENELFGHEKGAFTDAREARPGKFELAEGGTLFLDEIGDLSPGGQAKLLRVLEQKVITRLGGAQPIRINVRVVAATNANLATAVRERRFREDLYYRLNVVTVELPPLRERAEDVLPLAEFFLERFSTHSSGRKLVLSAEAKARLQAHSWPGNVRELRNLMERVAFLCPTETVSVDDLAFIISPERDSSLDSAELGLTEATSEFQAGYIRRMIKRVGGNMTEAARLLGLHRSNLYRKMRQLDMEESQSLRDQQ